MSYENEGTPHWQREGIDHEALRRRQAAEDEGGSIFWRTMLYAGTYRLGYVEGVPRYQIASAGHDLALYFLAGGTATLVHSHPRVLAGGQTLPEIAERHWAAQGRFQC